MKQALLLLNMGGPNTVEEVRLFLDNMFADKHILPMHPRLRKMIANRIITKRIDEVEENYRLLGGASPLPRITEQLIEKLKTRIDMPIYPAMRYVPPFAREALAKCKEEGVERLILFPMYPQYSTTTTLSSVEDIKQQCEALGYHPEITVIDPYYDDYDYVTLCGGKILEAMEGKETAQYDLLLSAHGLPMRIIKAGDPYEKQVIGNVSAIKVWLASKGVEFHDIKLVYQSKVGKAAWLEPNLADILRNPTHKKVLVYPLAFTIDNSETVFELDIEHREIAKKLKYEDYVVAQCFNDDDRFADLIARRVALHTD